MYTFATYAGSNFEMATGGICHICWVHKNISKGNCMSLCTCLHAAVLVLSEPVHLCVFQLLRVCIGMLTSTNGKAKHTTFKKWHAGAAGVAAVVFQNQRPQTPWVSY